MILVVTRPDCDHAPAVVEELRRRGERVAVFDAAEIPGAASLSVSFELGEPLRAWVKRAGEPFDLDDVEAVWLRRIGFPRVAPAPDAGFAVSESHHALVGLGQALRDRRWVNRLGALALDGGWGKVWQLDAAQKAGLEVPRTLVTNDPEEAREFVASCPSGAIYKPLAAVELPGLDRQVRSIYTRVVDESLSAQIGRVKNAPCVFQEKVPKAFEVRATVVGGRVFACEVHSQETPGSETDYRMNYLKHRRARHALPDAEAARLLALHRALGLVFGTSDLIRRPDGGYSFLETNQAGQWLWTADAFEPGELLGAFCDLLQGR